jgi:hypothetical protein
MEHISDSDIRILQEKSRTFCGSFKIPLKKLRLENIPDNPRQTDEKIIARLEKRFDLGHCDRLKSESYVTALISKADLPQGIRHDPFEEPQHFDPPQPLICIEGEHRLKAADKFLVGKERWWVANLYFDGIFYFFQVNTSTSTNYIDINEETKTAIREDDPGSKKFFDGDIYRHSVIAAAHQQTTRKDNWLAKLDSDEKTRNALCFEGSNRMSDVRDGLHALIPFTGLWTAFDLGHLPRLMNLHCPEVTVCSPIFQSFLTTVERSWLNT